MIDIQIDTSRLEAAIEEFATLARKDVSTIMRQQTGILVGHIIALTPPGNRRGENLSDSGGIDLAAKKRGEGSIAADIAKIFPTSNEPHDRLVAMVEAGFEWKVGNGHKAIVRDVAESVEDLRSVHKFARSPTTGRTRKMGGIGMAVTRKAILKQYIRQEIAKVGLLNAGWITAANELKTAGRNVPQWIRRHGARPGGVNVRDQGPRVGIAIYNSQTWFPSGMESRVNIAVARRERGLNLALAAMLERRARAAERRMGG